MKKSLITTAALLAFVIPARADQLPEVYLGQWCVHVSKHEFTSYTTMDPGPVEEKCDSDDLMTIKQNGLFGVESCRFRSVKKTNELRPRRSEPILKSDWTPVMEVLALCGKDDDDKAVIKMRLIYEKGLLSIEHKMLRVEKQNK
jgi:hypothetical protein